MKTIKRIATALENITLELRELNSIIKNKEVVEVVLNAPEKKGRKPKDTKTETKPTPKKRGRKPKNV